MIICITGLDGCGKSTQIDLLKKYFKKKDYSVFVSKAYGKDEKECLERFIQYWNPLAIMFFFQALHSQQRIETVKALKKGKIIIADRWDESYLAYHSHFGLLSKNEPLRKRLNEIAFAGIIPDITFLLDIPIEIAMERTKNRGVDFFDKHPWDYHSVMRIGYLKLAKKRKWIVLDGTASPKNIHKQIKSYLSL